VIKLINKQKTEEKRIRQVAVVLIIYGMLAIGMLSGCEKSEPQKLYPQESQSITVTTVAPSIAAMPTTAATAVSTTTAVTSTTVAETTRASTSAKPVKTTIKTKASTAKAETQAATAAKTTVAPSSEHPPATTKVTTAKPEGKINAWGSVSQMEADCKAYAQSIGMTWDSSLTKSNASWDNPTSSLGFDSAAAFKSRVMSNIEYYHNDGYPSIKVIFEEYNGGYKAYFLK
jgi:hypothetical protein